MTELVSCLSTGKGTWGQVGRVINDYEWEKVFLITNEFGKENFSNNKAEFIVVNTEENLKNLMKEIFDKLNGKIKGTEVALNLISGSGKEHMAILSALLKMGLGIRLMAFTEEGVEEI